LPCWVVVLSRLSLYGVLRYFCAWASLETLRMLGVCPCDCIFHVIFRAFYFLYYKRWYRLIYVGCCVLASLSIVLVHYIMSDGCWGLDWWEMRRMWDLVISTRMLLWVGSSMLFIFFFSWVAIVVCRPEGVKSAIAVLDNWVWLPWWFPVYFTGWLTCVACYGVNNVFHFCIFLLWMMRLFVPVRVYEGSIG
jgi:hypothetical protein